MKRSRLSRGLQMLYLQVIVGVVLTGVFSTVSAVLLAAAHTEAVETLLDMMELIPDVVSTVFTLVGLILLWRVHRGYRYALAATVAAQVIAFVAVIPQLSGISVVLGLVTVVPGFFYTWLLIRTTNSFLRQLEGEEALIQRGKTVLILWLGAAVLSAVVLLLLDPDNIGSVLSAAGPTLLAAGVSFVASILMLIYLIQASQALKYEEIGEAEQREAAEQ